MGPIKESLERRRQLYDVGQQDESQTTMATHPRPNRATTWRVAGKQRIGSQQAHTTNQIVVVERRRRSFVSIQSPNALERSNTMQPKFTDKAGHEFTPSELIGSTAAYGIGLGTIRRVIETRGHPTTIIVSPTLKYTSSRDVEWPLDRCTVCIGMTTNV